MSITAVNSANLVIASGTFVSLGFTPTAGNSLVVYVNQETAGAGTLTMTDNASVPNTYVQDYAGAYSSYNRSLFSCVAIVSIPTQIKITSTFASTLFITVVEVSGMAAVGFENYFVLDDAIAVKTHSATFSSVTSQCFAIVGMMCDADMGTVVPANGFTLIPSSRNARDSLFKADIGVAGTQTVSFTSSATTKAHYLIGVYKSAVSDPLVSTVSNESTTEGGSNVHTVTLSAATNRTTSYSAVLAGSGTHPAVDGVDFLADFTGVTFSEGVTYSGGNLSVPSGVSNPITVTVPTINNALDQFDRTYALTIGGSVAGTGTITDDDAPPVVTFTDGVESFGVVTCVATLGAVSGKDVKFDVSTANGSKTAGTNYTAIVAQTVTIPAGSLTAAITVNTL